MKTFSFGDRVQYRAPYNKKLHKYELKGAIVFETDIRTWHSGMRPYGTKVGDKYAKKHKL